MSEPVTLEEKAARYEAIEAVFLAELDQSLQPRGSDLLFDLVADSSLPAGSVVLDTGCGKGRRLVELAIRFEFEVIGIDPVAVHLELAAQAVASAEELRPGLGQRVRLQLGRVESLPLDDDSIDLVWCRDVLGLVADLDEAYSEFARVLRPGGRAVVLPERLGYSVAEQPGGSAAVATPRCGHCGLRPAA